jgi:hypothetical protein
MAAYPKACFPHQDVTDSLFGLNFSNASNNGAFMGRRPSVVRLAGLRRHYRACDAGDPLLPPWTLVPSLRPNFVIADYP